MVEGHDALQVELSREEVREEHVLRVLRLHVLSPRAVPDRIGEDQGHIVRGVEDHAADDVDLKAGSPSGGLQENKFAVLN